MKTSAETSWERYETEMWEKGMEYYRERIHGLNSVKGKVIDLGCDSGQWAAGAIEEGMIVAGIDLKISKKASELRKRTPVFFG